MKEQKTEEQIIKANKKDVDWYNEFYKTEQKDFTTWYVFMLDFLSKIIKKDNKLFEIGCGQSKGLRWLKNKELIEESNIYAIDQSNEAVAFSKNHLPKSHIEVGDIYHINHENNSFDFVLLMEVIEHLENPLQALNEIYRVLKPGGKLILSFPNYFNLPWLLIRILSEKLNKPNWIVLQPVDKIYNTFNIIKLSSKSSLFYKNIIGSNYFPPILYRLENKTITSILNKLKLCHLSFHPILIFEKK